MNQKTDALEESPKKEFPGIQTGFRDYLFFIFDIFHHIADLAFEDLAEDFDGVGADAFVSFEAGELSGADVILLDQGILSDAPFLHGFP